MQSNQRFAERSGGDAAANLRLVEVEGFSLSEASEPQELTLPDLKSRLHRARLRMVDCPACARFGEDVQTALNVLRTGSTPKPLSNELSQRLADMLDSL